MRNLHDAIDKYKALIDAIGYLNSSMKVDEVLKCLLIKSVELVNNADTGLIFIYNPETECLEVKTSFGFEESALDILIRPGESITGEAFVQNKTITVNGAENVREYMNAIRFYAESERNPDDFLGKAISDIKGVIGCPLRIKDRCIGVLVVDNFTQDSDFTDMDVEILEAISVQASLAIENARAYESSENNRLALDKYSKLVETERNTYRHATMLHNRFTEIVLTGASVQDLINEISSLLDSGVLFMDVFHNIEATCVPYSIAQSTIEAIHQAAVKNSAAMSTRNMTVESLAVRIQPIIVAHGNIGWLIIIRDSKPYSEEEEIAIDRCLTVLALEIMKMRQLNAMEEKYRGDFVEILISHQNQTAINQYAKDYHIDFSKPHRVLLIDFIEGFSLTKVTQSPNSLNHAITYYSQFITRFMAERMKPCFITNKLKTIIILLPVEQFPRSEIEGFFDALIKHYQCTVQAFAPGTRITAIASEVFIGSDCFSTVYSSNQKLLHHIFKSKIDSQWTFYEDSKVKQLLLRSNQEDLKAFVSDTLGPLLENSASNSELLRTLKIYISSNSNWTATKELLFIHGNTLTYRLKRISQILDRDINDYYARLHIQLALEILELFPISN